MGRKDLLHYGSLEVVGVIVIVVVVVVFLLLELFKFPHLQHSDFINRSHGAQ